MTLAISHACISSASRPECASALAEMNFTSPTRIQQQAIPRLMVRPSAWPTLVLPMKLWKALFMRAQWACHHDPCEWHCDELVFRETQNVVRVSTGLRQEHDLQRGRDALVNAPTGSGKTLAYLAPILGDLQAQTPHISRAEGTYALVLVPTRELCLQVSDILTLLVRRYIWLVSNPHLPWHVTAASGVRWQLHAFCASALSTCTR